MSKDFENLVMIDPNPFNLFLENHVSAKLFI